MKDFDLYKTRILKWACIGLLLRLILMPLTMHGQDLVFINYFPMMFVKAGIWDPYSFIGTNFSYFPYTYYGPVLFIIMSIVNFIFIKLFNPASLIRILQISSTMMFKGFTTVDYVYAFSKLDLFKNLFLMKSPYLIFDFLIAGILLRLAISQKLALASYKLWMLNIVVLHSTYAVGGFDLIVAFFIIAALYAAMKKRPYLSIILLSLGGATKLLPYVLILPTCLLLGHNWKNRFSLIFTGITTSILIYLPFYLSSGNSVFGFFALSEAVHYSGIARWILTGIFIALYSFISINATKDSQASRLEEKLLYYFIVIMFLSHTTFPTRLRYFISIMPLLALIIPQHKKFGIFTLLIILLLAFSQSIDRDSQLGLFAPINPAYFLNLPTIQEIIGRFINIEIVYKIMSRVLPLTLFISAWWIWRIKLNNERKLSGFVEGRSQ